MPAPLAPSPERVQAIAPGAGEVQAAAVPAQIPLPPGPLPDGLLPDGLRPDGLRPDGLRPDGLRPDGLRPDGLRPMLAAAGDPPAGAGWAVEFKWDGIRALVAVTAAGPQFVSRNGNDVTLGYPDLTGPWRGGRPVLLDGEIVALDAAGAPDFGLLQHRMHVRHPPAELVEAVPVQFFVFDVLHLGGRSLLAETYDVRREVLAGLDLAAVPGVAVPPHSVDVPPAQLLGIARAHGLEGVVSKRRRSRYEPGRRSPAWVKTALISTQEVVIGGWTPGKGRRVGSIGALLLGAHDAGGALRYLGHVGTGFSDAALTELHGALTPLTQEDPPFADPIPPVEARAARWVRPVLVGEVVYRRLTHDQRLRHAAWRGLRPDRDADGITLPGG